MNFSFSTTRVAKAETPVVKPFDMAAAEASMLESFERFNIAAKKLADTQSSCEELLGVVADSRDAIDTFTKFGVEHLAVVLNVYNGKDGKMDKALGLESLAVETLEKMDAAAKTLVKDQYTSALEANVGEAFKAFYEKAKQWLAEFVEWIKEMFVGNAKLLKMVQETKFDNIDVEAKISGMKYETAKKLVTDTVDYTKRLPGMAKLAQDLTSGKPLSEITELADNEKKTADEEYEHDNKLMSENTEAVSIKELGWDANKATEMAKSFGELVTNKEVSATLQQVSAILKKAAADAASGAKEKVDALAACMKLSMAARKTVAMYNKITRKIGVQLLRMAKAKAEAPAEEQKPAEAPKAE